MPELSYLPNPDYPAAGPPSFAVTLRAGVPDYTERLGELMASSVITQGYGPSDVSVEPAWNLAGRHYSHVHLGEDIALRMEGSSPYGVPVRAPASGTVIFAGFDPRPSSCGGFGNTVVIKAADGFTYRVGHLSTLHSKTQARDGDSGHDADNGSPLTHIGQVVYFGQIIGFQGSSGCSSGPHEHLEVHDNLGRPVPISDEAPGRAPLLAMGTLAHTLGGGAGYNPGASYGYMPSALHTMFQMPIPEPIPRQALGGSRGQILPQYFPADPASGVQTPAPPGPGAPPPVSGDPVGIGIPTVPGLPTFGQMPDLASMMPPLVLGLLAFMLVMHGLFTLTGGAQGKPAQVVVSTVKDTAKVGAVAAAA